MLYASKKEALLGKNHRLLDSLIREGRRHVTFLLLPRILPQKVRVNLRIYFQKINDIKSFFPCLSIFKLKPLFAFFNLNLEESFNIASC